MKTELNQAHGPVTTESDWDMLRRSRPGDYDGHTGFAQMTPAARLAWMETAVEFVTAHARSDRSDLHRR